jgi:hypothetical protein
MKGSRRGSTVSIRLIDPVAEALGVSLSMSFEVLEIVGRLRDFRDDEGVNVLDYDVDSLLFSSEYPRAGQGPLAEPSQKR